ncbi:hypothetical protein XFF6990_390091 [Xanthomonas citri pv. fuscans]|uniref:Transposase n=1 Tax=Xanthomonas campestris pv. phaseoli TaxID=317013 RepID=A0A7Z7IXM6_XANCH|nr:hypothetical protein XFF6990_390091 [Xanthomonas citri pv. fuscans]SOO23511.1 hypothetical protein XFF6991_280170 [Xanthomonas phaseoli pv. phaseoli]
MPKLGVPSVLRWEVFNVFLIRPRCRVSKHLPLNRQASGLRRGAQLLVLTLLVKLGVPWVNFLKAKLGKQQFSSVL